MKQTLLSLCILLILAGRAPGQTCNPVYAVGFSTPTASTDTITWTVYSNPLVAGAEYVLNMSSASPSGPGIFTTDTFYYATGLTPNTSYYFHLRFKCTNNVYSQWWTGPAFVTAPPTKVSAIGGNRDLLLYPNPTADFVSLGFPGNRPGTCVIYDLAGKVVRQYPSINSDSRLDVRSLSTGVYHVSVQSGPASFHMRLVRL